VQRAHAHSTDTQGTWARSDMVSNVSFEVSSVSNIAMVGLGIALEIAPSTAGSLNHSHPYLGLSP